MTATAQPGDILLAEPRGFCAGVDRAIEIVERALKIHGAPIYVRHEIVHNTYVVNDLKAKGAIFIEDLADVPAGATLVFSAHGVPKAVELEAAARGFRVFDATCPLVTKVHREAEIHHRRGREILLIGHAGHPEVVGTLGQLPDGAIALVQTVAEAESLQPRDPNNLAYVTQTQPRLSILGVTCFRPIQRDADNRFTKTPCPLHHKSAGTQQLRVMWW